MLSVRFYGGVWKKSLFIDDTFKQGVFFWLEKLMESRDARTHQVSVCPSSYLILHKVDIKQCLAPHSSEALLSIPPNRP